MKLAIIAVTRGGKKLAGQLAASLPKSTVLAGQSVKKIFSDHWPEFDGFICIMATGIAVRSVAPLLGNKKTDPCVVVLDEKGHHVISLLSGHLGGGNALAHSVAALTGGEPVITTASDTLDLPALDLWARDQGLAATKKDMTRASATMVNRRDMAVYSDVAVASLPEGMQLVDQPEQADLVISNRLLPGDKPQFYPINLVVGVGCNRGTPLVEFETALTELFYKHNLAIMAIKNLTSIDLKNDEQGLLHFSDKHGWPINFYKKEEINQVTEVAPSKAALEAVGAIGVAEPCALLSAGINKLLCRKEKWRNITMAVAEVPFTLSAPVPAP